MVPEFKLLAWIKAGLALYKANPRLTEQVFFDLSQVGTPTTVAAGLLSDTLKLWIPGEYAGGLVRYGGVDFPIFDNTYTDLRLIGDPSAVSDPDALGYQIVPPMVQGLMTYLATQTFTVQTAFAPIPAQFPAFTIRLERDSQADAYIGESLDSMQVNGVEVATNKTDILGSYVISVWTRDRDSTLWLYAWLVSYWLQSQQMFTTWGLSSVGMQGTDFDPNFQVSPEVGHVRHFQLSAMRPERAIATPALLGVLPDYVQDVSVQIVTQYAVPPLCSAVPPSPYTSIPLTIPDGLR